MWVLEGDPTAGDHPDEPAPLSGLGPDADKVSPGDFAGLLASKNQRVHGFLRDQHGVAGIGRMLANEICHRAGLSPFAMTSKLTEQDRRSLHDAMRACISEALDFERSREAMSRSADRPGSVHRRKGQACPVCGDTIRAVEYTAYEVDYCPTCQTDGKVLADNTTSRFLK
ncbi:MAG: zf-TFIIB domain-containing protein [Microthrixaceae bacterium]|nr:zf-TFIIB domain-containing protein [Microthrixaceae bacterium]